MILASVRWLVVVGTLAVPAADAWADCGDTGLQDTGGAAGDDDCDGDEWRKRDGDCDDEDPDVNPGRDEDCDTPQDENCDGFFDEGCERALPRGQLVGGSACGNSGSAAAWIWLPMLFLARGRRR